LTLQRRTVEAIYLLSDCAHEEVPNEEPCLAMTRRTLQECTMPAHGIYLGQHRLQGMATLPSRSPEDSLLTRVTSGTAGLFKTFVD